MAHLDNEVDLARTHVVVVAQSIGLFILPPLKPRVDAQMGTHGLGQRQVELLRQRVDLQRHSQRVQGCLWQKAVHEVIDTLPIIVALSEILRRIDVIQKESTGLAKLRVRQHIGMGARQPHRLPRAKRGDQRRQLLAFNELVVSHTGAQVDHQPPCVLQAWQLVM